MRYVAELNALFEGVNLAPLFQVSCLVFMLASVFTLQYAEQLDIMTERTTPKWGWFRRVSTIGQAMAVCWMMLYQSQTQWQPWPPMIAFILISTGVAFSRLLVMYLDRCRVARLGGRVAAMADALPTIRRSAASSDNHHQ